jgi:osmotically-inducible protein OsmY
VDVTVSKGWAALKGEVEAQALERSAQVDAQRITVEVQGSRIVLKGTVRSRAAWAAPGVTSVDNRITISYC